MLRPDDPWFLDEAGDESGELMKALPEVREQLSGLPDEELGLRALLEHPDALAGAWWRDQARRSGRSGAVSARPSGA